MEEARLHRRKSRVVEIDGDSMSRRLVESTVKFAEIDNIACDLARYMQEKGVSSSMAMNATLFLYVKCAAMCDADEEQLVDVFRRLLKQLRVLRPS